MFNAAYYLLKNQRFSTLVSLMLSSQTKDEVTDAAMSALRKAVGGSLSVDAILKADESSISNAICKVGFWRRKTQLVVLVSIHVVLSMILNCSAL